jgi:MFS family permease
MASSKNKDFQFGPKTKRNYVGTAFFVFVILFKLIFGIGNFVLGFAPDFIMEYFEMEVYYDLGADLTPFYIFLALGVLFIAQIIVSVMAIWRADFFDKNPGWKGSPFILTIVLVIFEWMFTSSIVMMAAVSTLSAILDIFTFVIFMVEPSNLLARKLRPFKPEPKEGVEVYPPQKPIQTV